MSILVTGATGLLGSHVVERLVRRGESVVALARLGRVEHAAALAGLLGDADPVIAHTVVKALVRLMVLSATYRQSSVEPAALRERDPLNKLFARQTRERLDAEFIRDTALSVSGLLNPQVGGVSVKPYQPAGYWANLNFPRREWQNDQGDDLYRRGLYTYWCRT